MSTSSGADTTAGGGKASEIDWRSRAAQLVGCELDEVDADPRLAEITARVLEGRGMVRLGPLWFGETEPDGEIGVWDEEPKDESDTCIAQGDTASEALLRAVQSPRLDKLVFEPGIIMEAREWWAGPVIPLDSATLHSSTPPPDRFGDGPLIAGDRWIHGNLVHVFDPERGWVLIAPGASAG